MATFEMGVSSPAPKLLSLGEASFLPWPKAHSLGLLPNP